MTDHTLPFDPESVTVDELPERLETIDDERSIHALQQADTRTTAAAHYERRVDAIRATETELTDEDRARGYTVGEWHGLPNYIALDGSMSTLDEAEIQHHVRRRGLIQE